VSNRPAKQQPSVKLASLREKLTALEQSQQHYITIEKELKEKAADLNLINDLNHAFNRSAPLGELTDLLAQGTKQLYGCQGATAYILSPDEQSLILLKHKSVFNGLKKVANMAPVAAAHEITIPLEPDSVYRKIIQAGNPVIINDQKTIEKMIAECTPNVLFKKMTGIIKNLFGIRSVIGVPLVVAQKTIGILDASRSIPFTENELSRFTNLAKHVALLLHHVQTEQHLKESESRYRTFVTNFQGIAYRGNLDFTAVFFHGAVMEITSYTEDDFVHGTPRWDEIIHPDDKKQIQDSIQRIAREPHYTCTREYRIIRKDGSIRWIREHAQNVCAEDGTPIHVEGSLYDISNEKMARDELSLSEKKFRQFFEHEPAYCYMISPDGLILDVNNTALTVLEYEKEELIGQPINEIYAPQCHEKAEQLLHQWKSTGMIDDSEMIIRSKNGTDRTVLLSARVIKDESGKTVYSISVQKDITAQKLAEEQIRSSLEEKKALLKEIHHRVKNNLQVISSLLNLQAQYIDNKKYQRFFKESQDRIKTMVLIHEKLYQSENLAAVSPSDYINGIVHHLLDTYSTTAGEVDYKSRIDESPIDIDLAIPCGLIVNELVSNSLKHAFSATDQKDTPRIHITLTRKNERTILEVGDNGSGIPPDIDLCTTKTLGLQLVHSLSQQLDAHMTVDRTDGTVFTFTFSIKQ
jgi:PAS domain S-box-containing protein